MANPSLTKRVYYTGGKNPVYTKEDEKKNKKHKAGQLRPVQILLGGGTYTLPEPGGYLELEHRFADELMNRYNYKDRGLIFFTDNPRLAKQIASGNVVVREGVLVERPEYSEAELEAMLAEARAKKSDAVLIDENGVVEDNEAEEVEEPKLVKQTAKPIEKTTSKTKTKDKTQVSEEDDLAELNEEFEKIGGL